MSEAVFTGQGFDPFPNSNADLERMGEISEWPDELIEHKVCEYWQFLSREDLQPRAREAAHRVLDRLGFEVDYRAGFYAGGNDGR